MSDNSELKYAVEFLRDDAKRHNPHDYADSVQWSAADALEALAGEVASLKLSNDLFQGSQKLEAEMNTQLTIQLQTVRAERDRLKAALERLGTHTNISVGERLMIVQEALGDAS